MTVIIKSGCPAFQESVDKLLKLIERELKSSNSQIELRFISCDLLLGSQNFPTWGENYKCTRYNYQEYVNGIYTFINSSKVADHVKDLFPQWLKDSFDVELNHQSHEELSTAPEKYALNFDKNLPEEHQEILVLATLEINNFEEKSSSITIAFPSLLYDHIYTNTIGGEIETKVEHPQEDDAPMMTQEEINASLAAITQESDQKSKAIKVLKEKLEDLKEQMTTKQFADKSDTEKDKIRNKINGLEEKLKALESPDFLDDLGF